MNDVLQAQRKELEDAIEQYLLARADWVPTEEICRTFGVGERKLRDDGNQVGLCSRFALSRTDNGGGYIHVQVASTEQYQEFRGRTRKHAIKELMRVRAMDRRRQNVSRPAKRVEWERDTGQGLIPGLDVSRRTA
jgi:hypothetical protein